MNRLHLQDIVDGRYGRFIAYTDVETITEENVTKVLAETIGIFNKNKPVFKYLWEYKNGDQPIRYRKKFVRDDVNNPVVENHAWEIVRFKNAQTNGEPIQCVSTKKEEKINQGVDRFNDYCKNANKHVRDISSGEWTSATGTGFKAVYRKRGSEIPFGITVPTPLDTYIVYLRRTGEPLLAVQELTDKNSKRYYMCFSETHEFVVQSGKLIEVKDANGNFVKSKPHVFGGIPIVEYPNNQCRVSDIELVMDLLDAINNMQSNRMDSIEQFVQSWVKFVNCDIDEKTFEKMKMMGALVVKSNNGAENKADVDIMSQELNQTESQVAKQDLLDNAWSILAIPNKQGNTGGDTQGAVELRNGWDFSKQAAKLKDPYTVEAEKRLNTVILNIIRQEKGSEECPFGIMDYDVQISHSPTDNMQVKTQVFQILVSSGIHPLIAIKTCGLWTDAEKVFLLSKPYLDAKYQTIDDLIKEVDKTGEQQEKANQLMEEYNNSKAGNENG